MWKNVLFWPVMIMLIFLFIAPSAMAAEFQGDVLDSRGVAAYKGHIWVKDGVYRLEMDRPDSPDSYIIVGAKPGTTQVIFPKYQAYMELPADDMVSQMNDPFQGAEGNAKRFEVKIEGEENIEGLACERQLVHSDGRGVIRRWYSKKLGFYIKNEQLLQDDWSVIVHNIDQSPVDDARFQIPANFKLESYDEISKRVENDPEVAARIAAYKKTRPRKSELRNSLSADETWNLVLSPGMKIRVKVKPGSKQATWFAVPYKGQTPLKSSSECTYQGEGNIKIDPDSGVDGIRIGVTEGKFIGVRLVLIGKLPHVQAAQRIFYMKKASGKSWSAPRSYQSYELLIHALSDPAAGFRFKANGKEQKEKIPAGQHKRFSFTPQDNLEELDIMMDYGRVKVVCLEEHRSQTAPHVLLDEKPRDEALGAPLPVPSKTADVSQKGENQAAAPQVVVPEAESSPPETGADAARTVLVLDASGSMWGQISGQAKIAIAKEVLTDLINDLPNESHAGLVAYGHRSKGDCRDVEELVPLQPIDKKSLIAKIKAISPKGKTPITLSIRKTAEKLKSIEEETTIILVSDGKETCEGDPCALVKELKEAGIRFTMYVIGFDVGEVEKAQLECIAKAGGGQYFTAKNAQEFRVAAKKAVKESQSFGYLKISALRNGKAIPARVDIFPQGEKKAVKSIRSATKPDWPGSKLKPGVYDLKITDKEMSPPQKAELSGVVVTAGATTEKRVDFSGGSLSVSVLADGRKETAGLYIYRTGESQPLVTGDTSRDNPRVFALAPGSYDLRVLYKTVRPEIERRFDGIEIQAGQAIEKRVEFGEGKLSVEVLVNGKKGAAGFSIFEAGTDNRVATGDTSRDNPRVQKLNPGTYDLQVVYKGSRPETKQQFNAIEIKPGMTEGRKAEFAEGRLSVEVLVNGKKGAAGLAIFEAGTDNRVATGDTSRDNPRVQKLNPGNYDLKIVYHKAIPKKEIPLKNIQIVGDQTTEQRIEYQEGILNVKVTSNGQTTRGGLSFFQPGDSRRIATGDAKKPVKMQPGEYEVVVKAYKLEGQPEKRISFTIQVGQTTNLDVDF